MTRKCNQKRHCSKAAFKHNYEQIVLLVIFMFLFMLGGCAAPRSLIVSIAPETTEIIILPPPPANPQMKYLYSIKAPKVSASQDKASSFLAGINRIAEETGQGEQFKSPMAITLDQRGMFYVVDQSNSMLLAFQGEAKQWRFIELAAGEPLVSLVGIAADQDGYLYLTDSALKKVFRLQISSGKMEQFAAEQLFSRPTGIAFNPLNDHVYVVDTMMHRVIEFDRAGKKLLEFGQRGIKPGDFNYPTYIAADREGNIYVADTLNFRVQSFTSEGKYRFSFGALGDGPGDFSTPKGVAVSPAGTIYVADGRSDRVTAFSQQGEYLFTFGSPGSAPGQLWSPNGIYVDEKDRVYVCDYLNNRVQVFQHFGDKL